MRAFVRCEGTQCSRSLQQLLYFNPDLKVTKPVILTNPIVFIGNVSIGANVTVFISNNDTTSPITGLSCVGVTDGTRTQSLQTTSNALLQALSTWSSPVRWTATSL